MGPGFEKVAEGAEKMVFFGEDGKSGGSGGSELKGERANMKGGTDDSLGGRSLFELGDDRRTGAGDRIQLATESAGNVSGGPLLETTHVGTGARLHSAAASFGHQKFQVGGHEVTVSI